jgi:hypothetical protein
MNEAESSVAQMWGRMVSCGGLATRLERRLPTGAQLDKLPHKGTDSQLVTKCHQLENKP